MATTFFVAAPVISMSTDYILLAAAIITKNNDDILLAAAFITKNNDDILLAARVNSKNNDAMASFYQQLLSSTTILPLLWQHLIIYMMYKTLLAKYIIKHVPVS